MLETCPQYRVRVPVGAWGSRREFRWHGSLDWFLLVFVSVFVFVFALLLLLREREREREGKEKVFPSFLHIPWPSPLLVSLEVSSSCLSSSVLTCPSSETLAAFVDVPGLDSVSLPCEAAGF